jgi:DNA-binding winged helix-turn-helix (wHTH) protein
MNKQFRLAQAHIDLTRNQIEMAGKVQTMQPKAMAVLLELVNARGQVVPMDELLQRVWPDTVVTPNTLQRCIAQLRKALGDCSREQRIIKTHARQGYSLEVSAEFTQPEASPGVSSGKRTRLSIPYLVVAGLVLLTLVVTGFYLKPDEQHTFTQMHYLTTTSGKESFASYSPDGRYVVFHRFEGQCENHLWSKDLRSQQETRLTQQAGYFQQHSFAPGGDRLAFVGKSLCAAPKTQECWELKTLDIAAALSSAQKAQVRMSCDEGRLYGPQWMNNGKVALLKKPHQGQWQLISYHVRDNTEQLMFAPTEARLYNLAYSAGLDKLAILAKTTEGKDQLTLLSSEGEVLSSAVLNFPAALSQFDLLELSFHPSKPKLLVYNTRHQFEVEFSGRITSISPMAAKAIYSLVYAPHEDKLLAAYGMQDWGFYLQNLSGNAEDNRSLPEKWDSTFADKEARFQPLGEHIAFISDRSGVDQVWLMDGRRTWQLSQFTQGSIAGLAWAPSGQQLLVNHTDRLLLLDLNGKVEALAPPYSAMQLFQWNEQDEILFSTRVKWQQRIVAWNRHTNQWREWDIPLSIWAQVDDEGRLISLDSNARLWLYGESGTAQPKPLLSNIRKRFVWQNNQVLAVNNQDQLVRYDTSTWQELARQPLNSSGLYVDDSISNQVLVAYLSEVQQDIVELSR